MTKALHVTSTAPSRQRNPNLQFQVDDFDLLCTILSALMWRRHNGPIKLYTDSVAYDYYKRAGILDIYDGGVDTDVLDHLPDNINYEIFWASGKLFALRNEGAPIAIIDTDLIVWKPISHILEGQRVAAFHHEPLFQDIYLPSFYLKTRPGYEFDPEWDWTVDACNAALTYMGDQEFLEYYTDCAFDFMRDNTEYPEEMISQMVFAEQRLLGMCAHKRGIPVYFFLFDPWQEDNDGFTHLWGAKDQARHDAKQRAVLCRLLIDNIHKLFPDFRFDSDILRTILDTYK